MNEIHIKSDAKYIDIHHNDVVNIDMSNRDNEIKPHKILKEFDKLKEEKFIKFDQLINEGKTSDEAFSLMKPDIDEMLEFIKENQTELQEEFSKDLKELIDNHKSDPMIIIILSMMFSNCGFNLDYNK